MEEAHSMIGAWGPPLHTILGWSMAIFHNPLYHLHAQKDDQKTVILGREKKKTSCCSGDNILFQLFLLFKTQHELSY